MYELLNQNFTQDLLFLKTWQRFMAYSIVSMAIALSISTPADSRSEIPVNSDYKNQEVVAEELVVQANPGDELINEIFYVLEERYGVRVDYFYIDGSDQGQRYTIECVNGECYYLSANNDSEVEVASNTVKKPSLDRLVKTKQISHEDIKNAVWNVLVDWRANASVEIDGVDNYGNPCTFKLIRQPGKTENCDYC